MVSQDPYAERIRGLSRVLVVAPSSSVFASAVFQVGLLPDRAFRVLSLEQAATIRAAWAEKGIKAAILDLGLSEVPEEEVEEAPAKTVPGLPKQTGTRGEHCHNAVLSEASVTAMRELHATGRYSCKEIAKEHGISESTARAVITRTTWAHVS